MQPTDSGREQHADSVRNPVCLAQFVRDSGREQHADSVRNPVCLAQFVRDTVVRTNELTLRAGLVTRAIFDVADL